MARKVILVSAVSITLVIVVVLAVLHPSRGQGGRLGIPLVRAAPATFLDTEAGIAAYSKTGATINLATAKTAYVIVEKETADYVLGWVSSPSAGIAGQPADNYSVRVYAARDGWVVAYFPRGEDTSKIIDWNTYSSGSFQTYLQEALVKVASAAGVAAGKVAYYHYGYPAANALTVIVGVRSGYNKTFSFKVPSGVAVSEVSWSLYGKAPQYQGYTSLSIAGDLVATYSYGGPRPQFGRLSAVTPDVAADIAVQNLDGYAAIAIVYTQP